MKSVEQILNDAGYQTVTGAAAVLAAIEQQAEGPRQKLCSGYRVFPDGTKCNGCSDCSEKNLET